MSTNSNWSANTGYTWNNASLNATSPTGDPWYITTSDGTNVVYNRILIDAPSITEISSRPSTPEDPHAHSIEGILRIESDKVVAEFTCVHCNEVLHRKVISKIPKGIIKKRCLPRIVKEV